MKFMEKLLYAVLSLCLPLSLLAGCEAGTRDNGHEPTDVCIVIGAHENFPVINVNALRDQVYDACYKNDGGSISAVVVDGQGQLLFDQTISPPQVSVNDEKRRQIAQSNTNRILQALSTAAARTPESDPLSALILAQNILADKDSSRKELVVIDSLLSTTGLLDLTSSNLLEQEPERVVAELEARHSIPNLTGLHVSVLGLGQVCGEQSRLTSDYIYKLEALWMAILNAGGCSSLEFSSAPVGNTAPEGLPHVSCVPVVWDSLSFAPAEAVPVASDSPSSVPAKAVPDVVRFDETSLNFYGDSAELIDPAQAAEALRPIAEVLRSSPETEVLLAGMTASAGGDGIALSLARAETVKSLLLEAGVGESQVSCLGLGSRSNCLRVTDLDDQGGLIESQAKLNRAVFLLPRGSSTAHLLLSQI